MKPKFDFAALKLDPIVEAFFYNAVSLVVEAFEKSGAASPMVFFTKGGRTGALGFEEFLEADKSSVNMIIQNLRRDSDAVAFVNEAWVTQIATEDKESLTPDKARKLAKDWAKKNRPSTDPNRKEILMIMGYVKRRTFMIHGEIKRRKKKACIDKLELAGDTNDDGMPFEGRFV